MACYSLIRRRKGRKFLVCIGGEEQQWIFVSKQIAILTVGTFVSSPCNENRLKIALPLAYYSEVPDLVSQDLNW
jgi:hypothetical protein